MSKSLEDKIAEITKKHNLELKFTNLLGDIDFYVYSDKSIGIKISDIAELKKVLSVFPINLDAAIPVEHGSKSYLFVGARIDLINPAKYERYECHFQYRSIDGYEVRLKIPIKFIEQFVTNCTRAVTESEYHYFVGRSYNELRGMQVAAYTWACGDRLAWYGGQYTLNNHEQNDMVINHLIDIAQQ